LGDVMKYLTKLQFVGLSNNMIASVSENELGLSNILLQIDINQNPFHCDCAMLWLIKKTKCLQRCTAAFSSCCSQCDACFLVPWLSLTRLACESPIDTRGLPLSQLDLTQKTCEDKTTTENAQTKSLPVTIATFSFDYERTYATKITNLFRMQGNDEGITLPGTKAEKNIHQNTTIVLTAKKGTEVKIALHVLTFTSVGLMVLPFMTVFAVSMMRHAGVKLADSRVFVTAIWLIVAISFVYGVWVELINQVLVPIEVLGVNKYTSDLGHLPVALNISAAEFQLRDVVADLRDSINRYQLDPKLLQMEVTETTIASQEEKTEPVFIDLIWDPAASKDKILASQPV